MSLANFAFPVVANSVLERVLAHGSCSLSLSRIEISVSDYFPPPLELSPKLVQSLALEIGEEDVWRRDDFFGIRIKTHEGEVFLISACDQGFFVKVSSHSGCQSRSRKMYANLKSLLCMVSPFFRDKLLHHEHKHSNSPPIISWIVEEELQSVSDAWLSQRSFLSCHGLSWGNGFISTRRDWNEEFQVQYEKLCKANSIAEEKNSGIFRLYSEFVERAQLGAMAVVDGVISPFNPHDDETNHCWVHEHIFYSYATAKDLVLDCNGGDKCGYKNGSHQMYGVKRLHEERIPGLFAPIMVVVDYRGRRVLCQGFGALNLAVEKNMEWIVRYGGSECYDRFYWDKEFEQLAKTLGERLFIKPSIMKFGSSHRQLLFGSFELCGFICTDNRRYLFDLYRVLPRDSNYPDNHHSYCLLRQELLTRFSKHVGHSIFTNTNCFVQKGEARLVESRDLEHDLFLLAAISEFLLESVIPDFVRFASTLKLRDSLEVVPLMHEWGISARYLGVVAATKGCGFMLQKLCWEEIIARSAKSIFRRGLNERSVGESAEFASLFLNSVCERRGGLWESVVSEAQDRFGLNICDASVIQVVRPLAIIRSMCLACGMSIRQRHYNFRLSRPVFVLDDIVSFSARTIEAAPKLRHVDSVIEEAEVFLSQIETVKDGITLLESCLAGFGEGWTSYVLVVCKLHELLGAAWMRLENFSRAIPHLENQLIILEQARGVDHYQTLKVYRMLAACFEGTGNFLRKDLLLNKADYFEELLDENIWNLSDEKSSGLDDVDEEELFIPCQDFY